MNFLDRDTRQQEGARKFPARRLPESVGTKPYSRPQGGSPSKNIDFTRASIGANGPIWLGSLFAETVGQNGTFLEFVCELCPAGQLLGFLVFAQVVNKPLDNLRKKGGK